MFSSLISTIKSFLEWPKFGINNISELGRYIREKWPNLLIFLIVLLIIVWVIVKILKMIISLVKKLKF
ncbi:MAG: hypothetical protein GBAus27B_000576 [Mycoplasmataceae bacterium]|nr:MAG: hypothetical protein GBAus27B_000576 [Mycoplasmataceae bacterium]